MQEILIDYIKGEQAEGKNRDVIEQQLIKSGYEAHQIETAFSMIDQEIAEPDSAPLTTDAQVAQLMPQRRERSLLNTLFMSPLNRGQFILISVVSIVICYVAYLISYFLMGQVADMGDGAAPLQDVIFYVTLFLAPILTLNIVVRRLHYIGESGWRALLIFIPIVDIVFFIYLIVKSDSYDSLR